MKAYPELPIIERCHAYKIESKFAYRCLRKGLSSHQVSIDNNLSCNNSIKTCKVNIHAPKIYRMRVVLQK